MSFEVKVTLYVECASCKHELETRMFGDTLRIEPCEKCMDEEYTEGHAEGYEAAKDEAE